MIAVAHQDANLPTEMSENMDSNTGLTQAMMMMAEQSHLLLNSDGMFDMSHSASNSRIPGKISKLK